VDLELEEDKNKYSCTMNEK